MSRIGKQPIKIPNGVKVNIDSGVITVSGPKGELKLNIPAGINIVVDTNNSLIRIERESDKVRHKMLHGTIRSIINNMVIGVTTGFVKELELQGVGYKVELQGNKLALFIGYNHPIMVDIPDYVKVEVPSQTQIIISGIDKQKVGQYAAYIRQLKKPDVYKGKGIRYKGEQIRKKEVKTSA